jgi:hypothetical protein
MAEPASIRPSCKTEYKLTESLAAPLIEITCRKYKKCLAHTEAHKTKRDASMPEREEALSTALHGGFIWPILWKHSQFEFY